MEEKKNNKGLIWLIIILITLVLGLVGYIIYDKVLKYDNENLEQNTTASTTNTTTTSIKNDENSKKYKLFETSMGQNQCVSMFELNYYDYKNSFQININDIKIDKEKITLKYIHDYEQRKNIFYINDKEFLKEDLEEPLLAEVCEYDGYMFIATRWEGPGRTLVVDKNGEVKKTLKGFYEVNNGVVSVKEAYYMYDEDKHVYESYKFKLEKNLDEFDKVKEDINCEDLEKKHDTLNEIEQIKFGSCI